MGLTLAAPFRQVKRQKFGGLYTEIPPQDLPEGISPLDHDCDHTIQSIGIRPGLRSAVNFGSDIESQYAGSASQSGDGVAWTSPNNILGAPDGHFASVITGTPTNQASPGTNAGLGSGWTNPGFIISNSQLASIFLPANSYSPELVAYAFSSLSIPTDAVIRGIVASLEGDGDGQALVAQLGSFDGATFTPNGLPITVALPASFSPVPVGTSTELWNGSWTPALLNDASMAAQFLVRGGLVFGATAELNNASLTVYYTLPNSSQILTATAYGFSITSGRQVAGIEVDLTGLATSGTVSVQLTANGVPIGTAKPATLPTVLGLTSLGGPMDGWSAGVTAAIAQATSFGIQITASGGTFNLDAARIRLTLTQPNAPATKWLKSFDCPGPGTLNLALDSEGTLWQEILNSTPGVMNSFYDGIAPGSKSVAQNTAARCFLTLSDLVTPTDQPRQYDGTNVDRISQVGPGQGPFITTDDTTYAINPSPNGLYNHNPSVKVSFLDYGNGIEGSGFGPGNILRLGGHAGQTNFTAGVQVGDNIYVSGASPIGGQAIIGTYTVSTVGPNWLFVLMPTIQHQSVDVTGVSVHFQKTTALVSLAVPIPNGSAQIGTNLTIAGAGVADWDGTHTIVDTPAQGQLGISATSLTSNIATYSYSLISGSAPGWQPSTVVVLGQLIADPNIAGQIWQVTTAGTTGGTIPAFGGATQVDGTATWTKITGASLLVTVFGTSNGNGIFNVGSATILKANQATFTVSITAANVSSAAEQGSAFSGQGTLFTIDPGAKTLGTATNPLFAASGGGTIVIAGSIASGQRYVITMFLTRNGMITPASPPVPFFTSESAVALRFTNLAIGPPNTIARIVALTPAGAGIGGPYFYIPQDVTVPDLSTGVTTTYNKTVIPDNSSIFTGALNFSDTVLLTGINVTEQGNNVLQKRELGACAGVLQYAGRMFYWGEQTKIDNLRNMTMDGGYLGGTPNLPAGWNVDTGISALVSLPVSPIFGNMLYIQNSTGSALNSVAPYVTLNQPGFQDAFGAPIIVPNTAYSARMTARIPSGITSGSWVIELFSPSQGSWSAVFAFSDMSPSFAQFQVDLNNPLWQSVPADLQVRIYPLNMANGADIQIDRMDLYPTDFPIYTTQLAVSYINDYESIDGVTGIVDVSQKNPQAVRSAYVLFDTLYVSKTGSTVSTEDNGATEPAGWQVRDVTQAVGALGGYAVDMAQSDSDGEGEDYALIASYSGVYLFNGGNHTKISQEIQTLWDSIYQPSKHKVWVKNDQINKRILVGIPLPTPNQWLPDAPTNATPAEPNVILACRYLGMDSPEALADSPPAHVSMFTGAMMARDMVRKWNIWQISTCIFDWMDRPDGSKEQWIGGADGTGAIFALDASVKNDNGAIIPQTYMTDGLVDPQTEDALQLGAARKLYGYATALIEGSGQLLISAYPETPSTPYVSTLAPFTMANPALDDMNIPLNETGNRLFLKFSVNALNSYFTLKRLVVGIQPDPRIPVSGR